MQTEGTSFRMPNSLSYAFLIVFFLFASPAHSFDRVQCLTRTEKQSEANKESSLDSLVLTSVAVGPAQEWKTSFDVLRDGRWRVNLDASDESKPISLKIEGSKDVDSLASEIIILRAKSDRTNKTQYVGNRSYSLDLRRVRNNQLESIRCYLCQQDISEFDAQRSSCVSAEALKAQADKLSFKFKNINITR
jgi:hypothetical protein